MKLNPAQIKQIAKFVKMVKDRNLSGLPEDEVLLDHFTDCDPYNHLVDLDPKDPEPEDLIEAADREFLRQIRGGKSELSLAKMEVKDGKVEGSIGSLYYHCIMNADRNKPYIEFSIVDADSPAEGDKPDKLSSSQIADFKKEAEKILSQFKIKGSVGKPQYRQGGAGRSIKGFGGPGKDQLDCGWGHDLRFSVDETTWSDAKKLWPGMTW